MVKSVEIQGRHWVRYRSERVDTFDLFAPPSHEMGVSIYTVVDRLIDYDHERENPGDLVRIRHEAGWDYDEVYVDFYRAETDEEQSKRLQAEAKKASRDKAARMERAAKALERERREYERLQKKFG